MEIVLLLVGIITASTLITFIVWLILSDEGKAFSQKCCAERTMRNAMRNAEQAKNEEKARCDFEKAKRDVCEKRAKREMGYDRRYSEIEKQRDLSIDSIFSDSIKAQAKFIIGETIEEERHRVLKILELRDIKIMEARREAELWISELNRELESRIVDTKSIDAPDISSSDVLSACAGLLFLTAVPVVIGFVLIPFIAPVVVTGTGVIGAYWGIKCMTGGVV